MPRELPPPELLRKLLRYDPDTGKLFWRERASASFNKIWADREALTSISDGYMVGSVLCRSYRAHRVIWTMETGAWPKEHLDHINGIRTDNRLANLREVTNAENNKNQRMPKSNTSGSLGVGWDKRNKKWLVTIRESGRLKYLGRFADFGVAVEARKVADARNGFHPNHGLSCVQAR